MKANTHLVLVEAEKSMRSKFLTRTRRTHLLLRGVMSKKPIHMAVQPETCTKFAGLNPFVVFFPFRFIKSSSEKTVKLLINKL